MSAKYTMPSTTDVMARELYAAVYDATGANNRWLAEIFMTLPTKFELPEYYAVVAEPIDMDCIRAKIDMHAYTGITGCITDFVLMFTNALQFNAAGTEIYEDARTCGRKSPLATKNLLEVTDGLRRPSPF